MPTNLIIVRTNRADAASLEAFDLYAKLASADVTFCIDERAAPADTGGRPKLAFNEARLRELGLYPHPNCGWLCGDYFYHATRAVRPDYEFYWLVEPDVRINAADLAGFFALFDANQADLLAPRLAFNDTTWPWTAIVAATGLPPWRCFYPLTRLSGRAIDHVHAIRRQHTANAAIATEKAWPNDEAITASALVAAGFACADLDHGQGPCHTGASLHGVALIDPGVLATLPPDGLIYHPVRDFTAWFAGAQDQAARIDATSNDPKTPGRLAGQALALSRIAQTCQRHPAYLDASLAPSLQAQALWARRPAAAMPATASQPAFKQQFDNEGARLCTARLQEHFGVTPLRPLVGTAHLADHVGPTTPAIPAQDEFGLGPAFDLGRFPRRAAIPYAWNLEARTLLLTIHLNAARILDCADPADAQRTQARAAVLATLDQLAKPYGTPAAAPLLFAFAQDAAEAAALATRLHQAGRAAIATPGALLGLAAALPRLGAGIAPPLFDRLVRLTIEPFRHITHPAGAPRCFVLPAQPPRLAAILGRQFPQARFVMLPRADRPGLRAALQRTPHAPVVADVREVLDWAERESKKAVLF